MYNACRRRINSEAGGRKRQLLKGFLSNEALLLLFSSEHQKNVLSRLCDCSRGLFVGFKCFQNDSNNIWLLCILVSSVSGCWISQPVNISYSSHFLLAKITRQIFGAKTEKLLVTVLVFHVKSVSVWSCLPLEFSTLGKCYLKEDTVLSGGALGSQQGALHFSNSIEKPSHTEKPFPAHTRTADKQAFKQLLLSSLSCTLDRCGKVFSSIFTLQSALSSEGRRHILNMDWQNLWEKQILSTLCYSSRTLIPKWVYSTHFC